MEIKNNDFIEIDFKGKIKNGEVFDSTFKEDLEEMHQGHDHPIEAKPFAFCVGHGMFLDSLDSFLIGKEVGKTYEIELSPENAFGPRDPRLVQMVPLDVFRNQRLNPMPGMTLNFDGRAGKIITVSGGRVTVDFNHSLSGKTVEYKIKVIRILTEIEEKVKALNEFFFRRDFKFEVKEKKLIMHADKQMVRVILLFKDKFKEILDLDLETIEIPETKKNKEKEQ